MGSGHWSATTYYDQASTRARTGKDAFAYSKHAIATGQLKPHQTLDPRGMGIRESRDNAEHPLSNAIIISLDVTGSMGAVVRGIHADLPRLHEMLLGHHYIDDPQIMFSAVGDATCDAVPLQVGQFESDNRMDQNIENMVLEGGGGGQKTESYELMLYVAARHTAIDCWEKRGKKGYLFIIGDEAAYSAVNAKELVHLTGGATQASIPLRKIADEARLKYHVFFVIPGGAAHGADEQIRSFWQELLGPDHVIQLDSPDQTSESIALAIGLTEGKITSQDAKADLAQRGIVGKTLDRLLQMIHPAHPAGPTISPTGARRL